MNEIFPSLLRTELYPEIEPHRTGWLPLDERHTMYWEESGNPQGTPVLFLHGGPGAGASAAHRRFFDPGHYRIVIFDQRDIEFAKHIATVLQETIPLFLSVGNPNPPKPQLEGHEEIHGVDKMNLLHRMKVLWEDIQKEPLLSNAIFLPQMHVLLWGNELGR